MLQWATTLGIFSFYLGTLSTPIENLFIPDLYRASWGTSTYVCARQYLYIGGLRWH